jgi:hypothetical protein
MKTVTWMLAALMLPLAALPTLAQPQDSGNTSMLGVARLSLADGDVTVQRGGAGDRMEASSGRPLVAEDVIATGPASRAEIQLGAANFARLEQSSALRILDLGNRSFRFEVVRGSATYSQLNRGEADVAIEARQLSLRPLKNGVYRVTLHEGAQVDVVVRKGKAELFTPRGVETLKKGRRAAIRLDEQAAEIRIVKADRKDVFDEWNQRRDRLLRTERSYRAWGGPWFPYWGIGVGFGHYWPRPYYIAPRSRVIVRTVARPGPRGRH